MKIDSTSIRVVSYIASIIVFLSAWILIASDFMESSAGVIPKYEAIGFVIMTLALFVMTIPLSLRENKVKFFIIRLAVLFFISSLTFSFENTEAPLHEDTSLTMQFLILCWVNSFIAFHLAIDVNKGFQGIALPEKVNSYDSFLVRLRSLARLFYEQLYERIKKDGRTWLGIISDILGIAAFLITVITLL